MNHWCHLQVLSQGSKHSPLQRLTGVSSCIWYWLIWLLLNIAADITMYIWSSIISKRHSLSPFSSFSLFPLFLPFFVPSFLIAVSFESYRFVVTIAEGQIYIVKTAASPWRDIAPSTHLFFGEIQFHLDYFMVCISLFVFRVISALNSSTFFPLDEWIVWSCVPTPRCLLSFLVWDWKLTWIRIIWNKPAENMCSAILRKKTLGSDYLQMVYWALCKLGGCCRVYILIILFKKNPFSLLFLSSILSFILWFRPKKLVSFVLVCVVHGSCSVCVGGCSQQTASWLLVYLVFSSLSMRISLEISFVMSRAWSQWCLCRVDMLINFFFFDIFSCWFVVVTLRQVQTMKCDTQHTMRIIINHMECMLWRNV